MLGFAITLNLVQTARLMHNSDNVAQQHGAQPHVGFATEQYQARICVRNPHHTCVTIKRCIGKYQKLVEAVVHTNFVLAASSNMRLVILHKQPCSRHHQHNPDHVLLLQQTIAPGLPLDVVYMLT